MRLGPAGWGVGIIFVCCALVTLIKTVTNPWGTTNRTPASQMSSDYSKPADGETTIQPALSPRDQYLAASQLLAEARFASETALEHIATWKSDVLPVIQQTDGDDMIVDQDLVDKLAYVIDKNRMTEEQIKVGLTQIERMLKRIDRFSTSDDPELLSPFELDSIRNLNSNARVAASSWETAVKRATAIIRQSYRVESPAARPSLQEQVEQSSDEKVLKDLSVEQVNGIPPAEVASTDNITAAGEEPSFWDSAIPADVNATLVPFLERRNIQPRLSGATIRFQKTVNSAPMSLSRLASMGALNESIDGLKRLVAVGADRELPEPRWHIHTMPNNWSDDDREFLMKAQQMLRDHGQALVAEGLLSK